MREGWTQKILLLLPFAVLLAGTLLTLTLFLRAYRQTAFEHTSALCEIILENTPEAETQLLEALKDYHALTEQELKGNSYLGKYGYRMDDFCKNVDKPTEGKVLIEGTDLAAMNRTQAAIFRRRKVGLVYQFYNLIPTLTIRKNILMPLLLDKRKPNKEYFEQIVRSLGIEEKLEALPGQLSGGQQQRAAIARSLVYRPAILLADEPTGNLDRKNGDEIIDLLKLSNRNLEQTILLITHDERLALEADRIITMEDGKIVGDHFRNTAGWHKSNPEEKGR